MVSLVRRYPDTPAGEIAMQTEWLLNTVVAVVGDPRADTMVGLLEHSVRQADNARAAYLKRGQPDERLVRAMDRAVSRTLDVIRDMQTDPDWDWAALEADGAQSEVRVA